MLSLAVTMHAHGPNHKQSFFLFSFLFCFSFMLLVSLCKELLSFLPGFVTQTDYVCLSTVLLYILESFTREGTKNRPWD